MKQIYTISEIREYVEKAHLENKVIGFVPTLGYLHDGHLSLVRGAREECDVVIVCIFVNPTQFGPGEDFDKYPRDIERDKGLAAGEGVDVIFTPSVEEIYPDGFDVSVELESPVTEIMCGRSRPGHFNGVMTIVAKLFNIVEPDKSYFGQKDAQQSFIIKRMTKGLNFPVEIRVMPIAREEDGLAMSSRNIYLSEEERPQALGLVRSLKRAEEMVSGGEVSAEVIKEEMKKILLEGKDVKIDYIETVDWDSLEPVDAAGDNTLIAVAAFIGNTRLIDNIVVLQHAKKE